MNRPAASHAGDVGGDSFKSSMPSLSWGELIVSKEKLSKYFSDYFEIGGWQTKTEGLG